ncbi:hypothetical protein EV176_002107 [Coemansia sp. RSA 451]|nr:hypothetical protein EV176_002107 [Coemansia sp. RSA 451]
MHSQSTIDKDHYALFAEVSVPWFTRSPATTKGKARPWLHLQQQDSNLQDKFRAEVDTRLARDTDDTFEEILYQAGRVIFGTSHQPTGPTVQTKVQSASWVGKNIRQMADSGINWWEKVWQLIVTCEMLLPEGILPRHRAEIKRLLAERCPQSWWQAVLHPHANYLCTRLQQVAAREAQLSKIQHICYFTNKHNEQFGNNFGQILKMLNKPRESSAIDRVIMAAGTLETDLHIVEKRTSKHFFAHFDVNWLAAMMVHEEWAGDYSLHAPDLFQSAGSPISGKLLD